MSFTDVFKTISKPKFLIVQMYRCKEKSELTGQNFENDNVIVSFSEPLINKYPCLKLIGSNF